MGQIWTEYGGMTTAHSWLFPYNPHRSRVRITNIPQGSWMEFRPCPWDCLVAPFYWHPLQHDSSSKDFPVPIPTSLCRVMDKILPCLRKGTKQSVQGSSVGSVAVVAVCLLWSARIDECLEQNKARFWKVAWWKKQVSTLFCAFMQPEVLFV